MEEAPFKHVRPACADWVLVPREPTEAMLKSEHVQAWLGGPYYETEARRVWAAFLQSAPPPPSAPAAALPEQTPEDETLKRARAWLKIWDMLPLSDPRSIEAKRLLELNGVYLARVACAPAAAPGLSASERCDVAAAKAISGHGFGAGLDLTKKLLAIIDRVTGSQA
jgi:hypothetical protein